ncbi:MAG TPA: hypothetical protein VHC20_03955 [Candidatus Paceibacterota bacterium]|nr:hypothetical protein [Candidatus Paceibacterota bacterium]
MIVVCVLLWLFICGALLLMLWPWRPAGPAQWLLFLLIGPLVYGTVEYVGERMLSAKIASRISPRRFSWLRIAYALFAFLLFLAVVFSVLRLLGAIISPSDA